jgi:AcrR family transcriptional regulator
METGTRPLNRKYRMVARADAVRVTADLVLDAALGLFTERPYDEVSLADVADRAGVTKRTVLRRFGTKESLFLAADERAGREEMERRDEAPVGDVMAAVAVVVGSYERFGRNRLRMLEQEERFPVVAQDVAEGRRLHRSWVERTFAPQIEQVPSADRQRRIVVLVALTDVYMWKLLRLDHELSREDTERALVDMIDALKGGPP